MREVYRSLVQAQAVPRFVGMRLSRMSTTDNQDIEVEASTVSLPSVL